MFKLFYNIDMCYNIYYIRKQLKDGLLYYYIPNYGGQRRMETNK